MADNNVGMEAVWRNDQFYKGQADYIKGITEASKVSMQAQQQMSGMQKEAGGLSGMLNELGGAGGISAAGMIALGAGIGVVMNIAMSAINAIGDLVGNIVDLGKEALISASRVEQLNYIAQILGQKRGLSGEQVNEFVEAIEDQGISMQVANEFAAQAIRYNVSLADSLKVAAAAQDAATLAGEGSSEALEGFLHAIATGRPAYLKFHGILIDGETAFKNYAESINKATVDLTQEEKVQATVNAIIEEGAKIQGAYAVSMETAGKQIGTMKSRLLPDLIATMGAPFQQGFFNAVKGINDIVEAITDLMKEGGALYPLMVKLGAIFELITEPIKNLGAALKNTDGPLNDFANNITSTASNMFNWGVDMMVNLANGIIQGASTVITGAINFVSKLLGSWFMPGSPPKVAPEIDRWGAATMNEYLKGFDQADFNILGNIQKDMKNVFGSLADLQQISKEAAQGLYISFSKDLIKAIQQGNFSKGLYQSIVQAGGEYGRLLADLAQKQFQLAEASKTLTEAQDNYDKLKEQGDKNMEAADKAAEAARKAYDDTVVAGEKAIEDAEKRRNAAGKAVNQGLMEYNQMMRGGASKEQLAAKLKEINANKVTRDQAQEQMATLEESTKLANEAAKAKLDQAQEEARLVKENAKLALEAEQTKVSLAQEGVDLLAQQEDLLSKQLQTMLDLNKAQVDMLNAAKQGMPKEAAQAKTTGGAAAGITPQIPGLGGEIDPSSITDKMRDAVKNATDELKRKFGEAWNSVKQKAAEALEKIREAWENSGLAEKWEQIKKAATDAWEDIKKTVSDVIFYLKRWWSQHGQDIIYVFQRLWGFIQPILTVLGAGIITVLGTVWNTIVAAVKVAWQLVWGTIKTVLDLIGGLFKVFAQVLHGDWSGAWQTVQDTSKRFCQNIWNIIQGVISAIRDFIQTELEFIKNVWGDIWDAIKKKVTDIWDAIKKWVTDRIEDIKKTIGDVSDKINEAWKKFWDGVHTKVTDIWNAIKKWVDDRINDVKNIIGTVTGEITTAWTTFWDNVYTKVNTIWTEIKTWVGDRIQDVKDKIGTISDEIKAAWDTFWDDIHTKVTDIWEGPNGIKTKVSEAVQAVKNFFTNPEGTGLFDVIGSFASTVWDKAKEIGSNLLNGLKQGIIDAASSLLNGVGGIVQKVLSIITNLLGIGSPSKLFAWYGEMAMQGLAEGITQNARLPEIAMASAGIQTIMPAAIPITAGTTNYYSSSFNMVNNIAGGADAALMQSQMRKAFRREFRRR